MPAPHRLSDLRSDRDFGDALDDLISATGMSQAEFARQMAFYGEGWTPSYISQVKRGTVPLAKAATVDALAEAAAKVAGTQPTYFREYREQLAAKKAATLAREIGLDEVLAALDKLSKRRR